MKTGRWVNDRPNRALTLQYIDSNGNAMFSEQALVKVDKDGSMTWQQPGESEWTQLIDREVIGGQAGAILRRVQPANLRDCKRDETFEVKDAFVPIDITPDPENPSGPTVLFRTSTVPCWSLLELEDDVQPFPGSLGRVTKIGFDPAV